MKFLPAGRDPAEWLPPNVRQVRGEDHRCFLVRRVVERLNRSALEQAYREEGPPGDHPARFVSGWRYAYALGMTSARRLEQRIGEDLGLRYLAAGAHPDPGTLTAFRRRHPQARNDLFTPVLELARTAGLARLGHVALDSTRIAAAALPQGVDRGERRRAARARVRRPIRRWQPAGNTEDRNAPAGLARRREERQAWEERRAEIPGRRRAGRRRGRPRRSRPDPDRRFLHPRGQLVLGYTAPLAPREDPWLVEPEGGPKGTDEERRVPGVEGVERRGGERPRQVSADRGFFPLPKVPALEAQGIDVYLPDSGLAQELPSGRRVKGAAPVRDPAHHRRRRKRRAPAGRAIYPRRKATVEPVIGVLKEQRGRRRFRWRGLARVGIELTLACTASNLTRRWRALPAPRPLA